MRYHGDYLCAYENKLSFTSGFEYNKYIDVEMSELISVSS